MINVKLLPSLNGMRGRKQLLAVDNFLCMSNYFMSTKSQPKTKSTPTNLHIEAYSETSLEHNVPKSMKPSTLRAYKNQDGAWNSFLTHSSSKLFGLEDCKFKTLQEVFDAGLRITGDGPCLGLRQAIPIAADEVGDQPVTQAASTGSSGSTATAGLSFASKAKTQSRAQSTSSSTSEGYGPYRWLSYNQVMNRALALGSGFITKCKQQPGQRTLVGIYVQNCVEGTLTDRACLLYNMISVPIFAAIGPDAARHIFNETEIQVVVTDTRERLDSLFNLAQAEMEKDARLGKLQHIVVTNPKLANPEARAQFAKVGITLHTYSEIVFAGKRNIQPRVTAKPDDTYLICYTSGTTGSPKGAIISHRNLLVDEVAFKKAAECFTGAKYLTTETHLSYLPSAHIMEIFCQNFAFLHGAKIGFFSGDLAKLLEDIRFLKPTYFVSVPRLCNRIYEQVHSNLQQAPLLRRLIFNFALKRKQAEIKRGIVRNNGLLDRIIFKRFHDLLGGEVKNFIVGAAPIDQKVLDFFRCVMGCHVYEAYGQTETSACATITLPNEWMTNHVGAPIPCNEVKLFDVPSLNYKAKDGRGEICVRGENCVRGYYKNAKATNELVDAEGWLHTGDVGEIQPNGNLKIVDRVKSAFKLAQGEFVAPERIEAAYARSSFVVNSFVHGDSSQSSLVAMIVPSEPAVRSWVKEQGHEDISLGELCDPVIPLKGKARESPTNEKREALLEDMKLKLKTRILEDLHRVGSESKLNGYEQVKAILLCKEEFTAANGLLTPTLKLKRQVARSRFAPFLNQLYTQLTDSNRLLGNL